MIKPKTEVPNLKLPLVNDTQWNLKSQKSETFTLIIFYRGFHCPKCKEQLEAFTEKLYEFNKRGVNVLALSCDSKERAQKSVKDWNISGLPLAYNLSIDTARDWGLFISEGISDKEPKKFSEPGLFLIRPDYTLYASSIQTMPFARPQRDDLLNAIDYITKNNYPARGGQ